MASVEASILEEAIVVATGELVEGDFRRIETHSRSVRDKGETWKVSRYLEGR